MLHIKEHWHNVEIKAEAKAIHDKIYELIEFLTDVLKVENLNASFPYKVGAHGLKEMTVFIINK